MTQGITGRFWEAKARTQETKQFIRDIKRITRRKFTAEEKIRIVLEWFRRDIPIRDLCRREGIKPSTYYAWLKDFMEASKIRGAGLDVYGEHGDPPPKTSRLLKLDNVVLTPHIGGVTAEDLHRNFYETSLGNIIRVVRGEEPKYVVN